MKRTIHPQAYEWLAKTKAAEEFGPLSALSYARTLRADARQNCLDAAVPKRGEPAAAVASDRDCDQWMVRVPLEKLIADYLLDCVNFDQAECLNEAAAMLERMAAKARRLQTRLKDR